MIDVPSDIAERIAPYGDVDRGIRKSKPDDNGLVQYMWRICRFNDGSDTHMPVSAYWWLQSYLDDQGIDASVSGIHDEAGKQILDELDEEVQRVVREEFGMDDTKAAQAWSKAGLVR